MEVRTPASLHLPKHVPAKNAPDFTFPNKDTPKTRPVLSLDFRRGSFGGVCNTPLHGYVQNPPDFTFPNKDAPKTRLVLGLNLRRGLFRGVYNTPLHVYMKNPPGSTFPHPDTPKTHPILPFPNRGAPKTGPILDPNLRRRFFRGVCNTPLHGYVKNLAGFIPKSLAQDISGRMQYAPTRIRAKFGGLHISAPEYAKNAPDFRPKPLAGDISGRMLLRPYTGTCKIWQVPYFPIRIRQKRTRFHPSQ